jgi:hypothetical protein
VIGFVIRFSFFHQGCSERLTTFIEDNGDYFCAAGYFLLAVETIALLLSLVLCCGCAVRRFDEDAV